MKYDVQFCFVLFITSFHFVVWLSSDCVKQWTIIGRFPSFPLQHGLTARRACAIQHTVAVPVSNSTFQVWGSNPSQGNFLRCDSEWQLIRSNQSIKLLKKQSLLIDRCRELGEGKKAEKNDLDWDSNPRPGNVELGKRPMSGYCLTQCSNGYSLGSLLFLRQDRHVQRCMRYFRRKLLNTL